MLMDFEVSSHPTWTEVLKDSSRGLDEADVRLMLQSSRAAPNTKVELLPLTRLSTGEARGANSLL